MTRTNENGAGMKSSYIRKVMERAYELEKEGREIVHMEVGEPDFDTPKPLVDATVQALLDGHTHYAPDEGLDRLREYVAGKLNEEKGLQLDPYKNVLITVGASEAIFSSLVGLTRPGDSVLIPEPAFGNYYNCCLCAGSRPVEVPLKLAEKCELDFTRLEEAVDGSTRFIVLNNPHNPTGGVFAARDIERLADFAIANDLIVISDEIYEDITYGEEGPLSIASVKGMEERAVLIGGFSKSYAMTGWRVGYVAAPRALYKDIEIVHQYAVTCVPTFTQVGIAAAIEDSRGDKEWMVRELDQRRRYLLSRIKEVEGMPCIEPQGAFYIFVNISGSGLSSKEFSTKLLEEGGLAVVPGSEFGPSGEGYIRLSYAASLEKVKKGMDILEDFMSQPSPATSFCVPSTANVTE